MIRPGEITPDDSEFDDADDQFSQRDIHSNGLDDDYFEDDEIDDADTDEDELDQAYDASEPAYTLYDEDDEDE